MANSFGEELPARRCVSLVSTGYEDEARESWARGDLVVF